MKLTAVFAVLTVCSTAAGISFGAMAAPDNADPLNPSSINSNIAINPHSLSAQQPDLQLQRDSYQKALQALRHGDGKEFRKLTKKLDNYPLKPYLEYAALKPQLRKMPRKQVDRFLTEYHGQRIADTLRLQWLKTLKRYRRGNDFIHYYQPGLSDTKLRCYYQYARYRTGNQTQQQDALQQALRLWQVGKSQPKECDPLFNLLKDSGKITDQLRWQRYSKALINRKYQLARYLKKRIEQQPYANWAANASATSKRPELIANYRNFADQSPEMLAIIEHSLRRLASTNAKQALHHWQKYAETHPFDTQTQGRIVERLVKSLSKQQQMDLADQQLIDSIAIVSPKLLEWRIRRALTNRQWHNAQQWIARLPEEFKQEPRWRYWQARLAQQLHGEDPAQVYAELAQRRSFYGFLASEKLAGNYNMNHQPVVIDEMAIKALQQIPGVQRARELYHHGETLSARREWQYASRQFSERQFQLAAELTRRWGWSNQSIVSMIQASYWNDIEMRFPLTYQQQVTQRADQLNIDSHLLLALARQESALAEDAISPVGARGLMQLMPATAKQTARKHKIDYRNSQQLLNPDKNIELGTRYFRELLDRFDNNRILAAAAYNAGPHRVSQWLKNSGNQLHFDAWIETIPFKETRHYVQNVLAFSAIYAHLLGDNSRILSDKEKEMLL